MFEPKGMDWEYWVQGASRDLWKIDGIVPPPTGSEMEMQWKELSRPVKVVGSNHSEDVFLVTYYCCAVSNLMSRGFYQ